MCICQSLFHKKGNRVSIQPSAVSRQLSAISRWPQTGSKLIADNLRNRQQLRVDISTMQ
ncbi:hypothetical protein [Moorena sp. SIO4G3]|uniref:hypothetical protein n=1 Tax=Moorena sp. SIO4G3 TaxID=2607821 RepID=UPI0025EA36AF|nr:hypothetical protein [Moorena sp. SIO4G3]